MVFSIEATTFYYVNLMICLQNVEFENDLRAILSRTFDNKRSRYLLDVSDFS